MAGGAGWVLAPHLLQNRASPGMGVPHWLQKMVAFMPGTIKTEWRGCKVQSAAGYVLRITS